MQEITLMIGNSDGIGLATTKRLLATGRLVLGISRSRSPITADFYEHHVMDVGESGYSERMEALLEGRAIDLCIYFAGIGELLDPADMRGEARIIDVNLTGMVRAAAGVIPGMVKRGGGHFIGVSSLADELLSAEAPSYHASKAGFTNYLGGLAIALRPMGVSVTNVRFGFVNTKMAKGSFRPFMMSVDKAADNLERCITRRPVTHTAPLIAIPLVKFRRIMMKLGAK